MSDSKKKSSKSKVKKVKESKKNRSSSFSISGPVGPPVLMNSASPSTAPPPPSSPAEEKVKGAIEAWLGVDGEAPPDPSLSAAASGGEAAAPAAPRERKWRQKMKTLESSASLLDDGSPQSGAGDASPAAPCSPGPERGGTPNAAQNSASAAQANGGGAAGGPPGSAGPKLMQLSKDMRTNVVNEIIQTEEDYVRDLDVIVNTYLLGLRNQEKLLAPKDLDLIFSNTEQLLAINTELLRDLGRGRGDPTCDVESAKGVAEAFIRLGPYLKSYTVYCAQQQHAVAHLTQLAQKNERLAEVLNHYKSTPAARKLDLPSYLIKPVQRICKYPLLLRELIKATPEGHADHAPLKQAESMVQLVASAINEGKRSAEATDWLFDLQNRIEGAAQIGLMAPARKFIRSGPVKQITAERKVREDFYFLFNDLLLVVEPLRKEDHYLLLAHFPFGATLVNAEPGTMPSPNAFELVHLGHSKMILYMDTEREKEELFYELAALIRAAKGEVIEAPPEWRRSVVGKAVPKPPSRLSLSPSGSPAPPGPPSPGPPSPTPSTSSSSSSSPSRASFSATPSRASFSGPSSGDRQQPAKPPPPPPAGGRSSPAPSVSARPVSAVIPAHKPVPSPKDAARPASEIAPAQRQPVAPAPGPTTARGAAATECCHSCKTPYSKPDQRFCTHCGGARQSPSSTTSTTTSTTSTTSSGYSAPSKLAHRNTVYKYQPSTEI